MILFKSERNDRYLYYTYNTRGNFWIMVEVTTVQNNNLMWEEYIKRL